MKIVSTKLLPFLALAALAACGDSREADVDQTASDITKRINPDATTAAFELGKPWWDIDTFGGVASFHFDGIAPEVGKMVVRPAGSYKLDRAYLMPDFGGGITTARVETSIPLTIGFISVYTPAGIRVSRAKPITAGEWSDATKVDFDGWKYVFSDRVVNKPHAVVLAGSYNVITAYAEDFPATLAEGGLLDLVLPVQNVHFVFDPINPDYPGDQACNFTLTGKGVHDPMYHLRNNPDQVLPAGALANLAICDVDTRALLGGDDITIRMNRLEVNDVAVTTPAGSVQLVPGRFTVDRKTSTGSFERVLSEETHHGVDLPDGVYRVTSTAPNAPSHVVEVSFP